MVNIASCKSDPFAVRVGLHPGYPMSPVLFIISWREFLSAGKQQGESSFGGFQIPSLLNADDMVLLVSLNSDLQLSLGQSALCVKQQI